MGINCFTVTIHSKSFSQQSFPCSPSKLSKMQNRLKTQKDRCCKNQQQKYGTDPIIQLPGIAANALSKKISQSSNFHIDERLEDLQHHLAYIKTSNLRSQYRLDIAARLDLKIAITKHLSDYS